MHSYWEQQTYFVKQDIIIIGSGFMGLWSAIELKKKYPTYQITILEGGIIPTGASTKNAGFSCFGSPTELIKDAELLGEDTMWQLVYKRYHGLRKIHNTFSYKSIDYENSGGYECLLQKDYELVTSKLDWLNEGLKNITGIDKTFKFSNAKLEQFGLHQFDHLIENTLEGCLHPAKLVQQLENKARNIGIQILTGIEIVQYENTNEVTLLSNNNLKFSCKQLLVCTNGFAKKLFPSINVQPKRSQVFITAPIEGFQLKGTFHFEEGFYYFRNVGNCLLVGGARNKDMEAEDTAEIITTETIQTALLDFTKKHILPNKTFSIAKKWAGIMGFGYAKQPIVQQIENNIYCAVRLSGMGVALAPLLAEDVAALM